MIGLRGVFAGALAWTLALLAGALQPGACLAQFASDPGGENRDFGVAPSTALRLGAHAAPTPREIPGASVIRTVQMRAMLEMPLAEQPLLFDVLGGGGHDSIPGAIWLADAGRGESFEDGLQARLAKTLGVLTRGDQARAMVFFCANTSCWLSYNAALRAVKLGYTQVGWYRGGIDAWLADGGALAPMRIAWKRPETKN